MVNGNHLAPSGRKGPLPFSSRSANSQCTAAKSEKGNPGFHALRLRNHDIYLGKLRLILRQGWGNMLKCLQICLLPVCFNTQRNLVVPAGPHAKNRDGIVFFTTNIRRDPCFPSIFAIGNLEACIELKSGRELYYRSKRHPPAWISNQPWSGLKIWLCPANRRGDKNKQKDQCTQSKVGWL